MTEQLRQCLEDGAPRFWEAFIRAAQPVIASTVVRTLSRYNRASSNLADDLIQDTFVKLCANGNRALRSFRGTEDAALRAWLRTVAASVVIDHLNSASALSHGGGHDPVSLDDPDAGAVAADDRPIQEIERRLMRERIDKCLEGQQLRDRRIFWLYHLQGFRPRAIADWPGIGIAQGGVETIVYRLTKLVADCVRNGGLTRAAEGVSA